MGLLSIFHRQTARGPDVPDAKGPGTAKRASKGRRAGSAAAATVYTEPPDAAEAVREARARARRRLMGATVLLVAGVIGFPLLFETQPRPIPVDLPIDIPSRTVAANDASTAPARATTPTGIQPIGPAHPTSATESVSYDARPPASASRAVTSATNPPSVDPSATNAARTSDLSRSTGADANRTMPSAPPSHADARTPSAAPTTPAATAAASRAYALLNPSSTAPATTAATTSTNAATPSGTDAATDANRFVVQIGAFADDAKVHDVRAKVEKLGLKTYTQSVDTPAGKRVRVRVGPYATHADADKTVGRLKADGLPAVVLTL